jgi:prevent-host-death family protein
MPHRKIEATEARKAFSKTLKAVRAGTRAVITNHGKPAAVIVSPEDYRFLRMMEKAEDAQDIADAREALAEGGAIPWDEFKAELGL